MPGVQVKSGLAAKLSAKAQQAAAAVADKPPEPDRFDTLPPNIRGKARVTTCKFGTYDEKGEFLPGEYYFMAMGTVLEPAEYAGAYTKVGPLPVSEVLSKGDSADNYPDGDVFAARWGKVADILKNCVGEEVAAANPQMFLVNNAESTAEFIQNEQPVIKFRTSAPPKNDIAQAAEDGDGGREVRKGLWYLYSYPVNEDGSPRDPYVGKYKGKPQLGYKTEEEAKKAFPWVGKQRQDNVFHHWGKRVETYEEPKDRQTSGVHEVSRPSSNGAGSQEQKESTPTGEDHSNEPFDEYKFEVESLINQAQDADDDIAGKAQDRIVELLVKKGFEGGDKKKCRKYVLDAASWDDVQASLLDPLDTDQDTDGGWKVGDPCGYKPLVRNPRTKKMEPSAKTVQCSVIAIADGAYTLKSMIDKKTTYEGVKEDELLQPD